MFVIVSKIHHHDVSFYSFTVFVFIIDNLTSLEAHQNSSTCIANFIYDIILLAEPIMLPHSDTHYKAG